MPDSSTTNTRRKQMITPLCLLPISRRLLQMEPTHSSTLSTVSRQADTPRSHRALSNCVLSAFCSFCFVVFAIVFGTAEWMGVFMAVFGVVLLLLLGLIHDW